MSAGVLTGGSWPHYGGYRRGEKGGSVSSREAYRNTLTYALAIAGDEVKLAALLKIRVPQLMNWLHGVDDIPDRVFLAAVDVVVGSPPEAIARSRELLVKSPRSMRSR